MPILSVAAISVQMLHFSFYFRVQMLHFRVQMLHFRVQMLHFSISFFTWKVSYGMYGTQTTQKNMLASDAITPICHSRNRTIPIRHYLTDLFLISCPTFLLIFTVAAIFDTSGGRRRSQPFFHIIPSLADSRPIVLSFINNLPAVLYNMFSTTIRSA